LHLHPIGSSFALEISATGRLLTHRATLQYCDFLRGVSVNPFRFAALAIAGILLTAYYGQSAYSQWSKDPTVNTPVYTLHKGYATPTAISDGSGGAILTWFDDRSGKADIYAQRLNRFGRRVWTKNGVLICNATNQQFYPAIASDGKGGAIIAWSDQGRNQVYAQHVDSLGRLKWMANGIQVALSRQSFGVKIISDGRGGAIITFMSDFSKRVLAQCIDSAGKRIWSDSGVTVCSARGTRGIAEIIVDGMGGAIILWDDMRSGRWTLCTQRVDAAGKPLWTADGIVIINQNVDPTEPDLISDGAGGAIYVWGDNRTGSSHVRAQRISASGAACWIADGEAISSPSLDQNSPVIAADGAGGGIICWIEPIPSRSINETHLFAQRVTGAGELLWNSHGAAVCPAEEVQWHPRPVQSDSGSTIIVWNEGRSNESDILSQRLSPSGKCLWTDDGIPISTAKNDQTDPVIVPDGRGGAIIAWKDRRFNLPRADDVDFFAQRVARDGNLGP